MPRNAIIDGVRVVSFDVRGNLASGMSGEVERYRHFVRSGGWDLVVNHGILEWPTDAILENVTEYPWPSVVVTHGLLTVERPMFRSYFKKLSEILRHYAGWICVSGRSEEMGFAQKFGLASPHVITNGVNLGAWARPPVGVRSRWGIAEAKWIVNVSNHYGNHHKNHRMFFEIARQLRDTGARFTLIGNSHRAAKWNAGSLGIRGGCFYECKTRAMLSRDVELKSNVPREDVVSAIQEADLLVSTSRWEANSVVLIESMAAGTPWVSTDVGSAREQTGGIVATSSTEFGGAIRNLLRDANLRKTMGEAGRLRAQQKHAWDTIAEQYERVYLEAVSKRRAVSWVPADKAAQKLGAVVPLPNVDFS
jgi:glycosyltransferase involved in cell wall biosynthesis